MGKEWQRLADEAKDTNNTPDPHAPETDPGD
jgi:hypothetical protein